MCTCKYTNNKHVYVQQTQSFALLIGTKVFIGNIRFWRRLVASSRTRMDWGDDDDDVEDDE